MRYFVTGGAGFIGSNFVDLLMRQNSTQNLKTVTVFDNLTYAGNLENLSEWNNDSRLNIKIGDICDQERLISEMTDHDVVIHFAAESHVDRSIKSAEPFVRTNVLGSLNVFEAARQVKVKTVIHISTDEVYGSLTTESATEDFLLRPNSPYAASKASSDLLARSYYQTYGMDIRVTRCSNNFGPKQHHEKLIPLLITKLLKNEDLPIYGDGKNRREWIYVEDHCKQILDVLNFGSPGEIYNIGSGNEFTNLEIVQKLISYIHGSTSKIVLVQDRLGHDFRYSVNSSKIHQISQRSNTDFDSMLASTIDWYSSKIN